MSESIPFHSVAIVGAGISGLTAARDLLPEYPDLIIVEARQQKGGRVCEIEGLLPWSVNLGPEFIHGAKTSLQAVLEDMKCTSTERAWPDYWYFSDERQLKPASEQDADVAAVLDRFGSIGSEPQPDADISAEEWLRNGGASERMVGIADACIANDFGCSISQLGLRETILENQRWDVLEKAEAGLGRLIGPSHVGEEYLILDRSLSRIIDYIGRSTAANLLLDWPVYSIKYANGGALLKSSGGRQLRCSKVVISIPITGLKEGGLLFEPPLPLQKASAIERIQMSNAVKVIIVLDRPVWPEDFFDVVCPGSFFPELWVTRYPSDADKTDVQLFGITAFACGLKAEKMSRMRESSIVLAGLRQLDEIFGSQKSSRTPATQAFVRAHVADWSKEKFIGGAYSYPSLGAELGDRDRLAEPVGNVLFFAGEATHPAVNPCLQAAMETGVRAAAQVQGTKLSKSRL